MPRETSAYQRSFSDHSAVSLHSKCLGQLITLESLSGTQQKNLTKIRKHWTFFQDGTKLIQIQLVRVPRPAVELHPRKWRFSSEPT